MKPILPGATIGIMGGGQLGRMLVLAGRRLSYCSVVLDPDPGAPAAQVADHFVHGRLDDSMAARELAAICDVVTLETEHVPAALLAQLEATCRLYPKAAVLDVVQDRLQQREFLGRLGIPQAGWRGINDFPALEEGVGTLGCPCVLKTRWHGYDGRGQAKINMLADCPVAWDAVSGQPAVLETWVEHRCEVSVVLARTHSGELRVWPLAENIHRQHILHMTLAPARLEPGLAEEAIALASAIVESLDHVGVLAVEFFVTTDGTLLVNEIAPRVHNSGHFTEGACVTSQFEQHLRAICGLPLGATEQLRPAVMLNLLGDLWAQGEPDWLQVLSHPAARLQLYGKAQPRPGRKMGHVVVTACDLDKALETAMAIHSAPIP